MPGKTHGSLGEIHGFVETIAFWRIPWSVIEEYIGFHMNAMGS